MRRTGTFCRRAFRPTGCISATRSCWPIRRTGLTICTDDPRRQVRRFSSRDLETWQGPRAIFQRTPDFWGDQCFWAAECHAYKGKYYLFATVRGAADSLLGTAVFVADSPKGPFREHSKGRLTPRTWQALDGRCTSMGRGIRGWFSATNGRNWATERWKPSG